MSLAAEIRGLYTYTDWANDRILAAVRELSGEQYTRHVPSSFPTIRDTLSHIALTEWLWLERWKGTSPTLTPEWSVDAPLEVLEDHLHSVAAERRDFLDRLEESALEQPLAYRRMSGEPYTNRFLDVFLHVVNHSTYHRGQITTMLRQVGAVPPATDLIVYRRESPPGT